MGEFWSALIGAVIGGSATFCATWLQHYLENKRKLSEGRKSINATLEAIKAEVRCLRERYDESIGHQLENTKDDTPFLFIIGLKKIILLYTLKIHSKFIFNRANT